MEDRLAQRVVDEWSGGAGVVARGPKMLLSVVPAPAAEVERYTGRRPQGAPEVWRLDVGGRFVASQGAVYPSGVPFPEELHSQTAVISGEVWLYADEDGDVVGVYWWPDAVRRPIASVPRDDYSADETMHPLDAHRSVDVAVPIPDLTPWVPVVAASRSRREVVVFCTKGATPEPVNAMCVYEQGGISLAACLQAQRPDVTSFLRRNQPPYRRLHVRGCAAIGRDPGRVLGPQTWPWPAELQWWEEGTLFEVKGFDPLATLVGVASSIKLRSR